MIDVSSYNGTVNWKKVKDQKINHAMLKIGSGIDQNKKGSKDSRFSTNFRNAGYASIHRGIYYYSYAKTTQDAKKEAKHCLSLLKEQGITPEDLDLPVAFDIEEEATFQTGRSNVTAITTTFCDALKDAGYEPMVYSGASDRLYLSAMICGSIQVKPLFQEQIRVLDIVILIIIWLRM